MKKVLYSLMVLSLVSCFDDDFGMDCLKNIEGNGMIVTKKIEIGSIKGIEKSGSLDVVFREGKEQHIEVRGDSNIIEFLNLSVRQGIWDLKLMDDYCYQDFDLTVDIQLPSLERLVASGSGNIIIDSMASATGQLLLERSGSGNITVQKPSFIDVVRIVSSGSGNINAFNLHVKRAEIVMSGSSNLEISVSEDLAIQKSGSGNLYYKGDPKTSIQVSGSGQVVDAD